MVQVSRKSQPETSTPAPLRPSRLRSSGTPSSGAPRLAVGDVPKAVPGPSFVCPFLVAADLSWRAASPQRAHRCDAVVPRQPVALDLQRELCLVEAHRVCDRFVAAARSRSARSEARHGPEPRRHRPLARTMPLLLERGHVSDRLPARPIRASVAQLAVAGLLLLAVAVIFVARTGPATPASSPSPSLAASVEALVGLPSASPTPIAETSPPPEPSPSAAAPSASPSASPATRTYRVRSGDTLLGIANRFGTTVRAILRANAIARPDNLQVGRILVIP